MAAFYSDWKYWMVSTKTDVADSFSSANIG